MVEDVSEAILEAPIDPRLVPTVSIDDPFRYAGILLRESNSRFAQQGSGVYGIVNFFPLLINSLGLSGDVPLILYGMDAINLKEKSHLTIKACFTTTATITIGFTMWLVDRFGRRALLCAYTSPKLSESKPDRNSDWIRRYWVRVVH